MISLLVDSDGGIDDAVGLWWAAVRDDVELVALTSVWGNVDERIAASNLCRVLHLAGRPQVPVAIGAGEPFGLAPLLVPADFIHGVDGVGNTGRPPAPFGPVDTPARELLRRTVDDRPGEVVVVTLGPLTNLAHVVQADPTWATRVRRLVVMGGAIASQGNAMPVGEANIAHDPSAAQVVLSAAWSTPPLLVGLDVTQTARLHADDVDLALLGRTAAAADLGEMLVYYRRFGGAFCPPGEFPSHDALAVMAAVLPGIVGGPVLPLAVETHPGPAQGMTVADRRQPFLERNGGVQNLPDGFHPVEVGLEVDAPRFRAEIRALLGAP